MRLWRPRLSPRWPGVFAPSLLAASLALNVLALYLPFMVMRRGFSSEPYSLFASVRFLWDSSLYVLACVVVAFSVVFPFLKLGLMATVLLGGVRESRERRLLEFVERYGKWSMLDVFLVCILLALANDQFWIDAQPRLGLICFTLSIVGSMFTSRHMLARASRKDARLPVEFSHPRWLAVGQALLLALLVAVLRVPFLEINDWLLDDHPVSLLSMIEGLWGSGARALAGFTAIFLALAPLCAGATAMVLLVLVGRRWKLFGLRSFVQEVRHWSMLEVFALALGIFLVEGKEFVRTELTWGAFLLALLLALYWPLSTWYERRV